jgi:hypothetical protein
VSAVDWRDEYLGSTTHPQGAKSLNTLGNTDNNTIRFREAAKPASHRSQRPIANGCANGIPGRRTDFPFLFGARHLARPVKLPLAIQCGLRVSGRDLNVQSARNSSAGPALPTDTFRDLMQLVRLERPDAPQYHISHLKVPEPIGYGLMTAVGAGSEGRSWNSDADLLPGRIPSIHHRPPACKQSKYS